MLESINFDKEERYLSSGIRLGLLFDGVARIDPGVANGMPSGSCKDFTTKELAGVEGQKLVSAARRSGVEGIIRELSGKVQVQSPSPVWKIAWHWAPQSGSEEE